MPITRKSSLHIGLNQVDPSAYNQWQGSLQCCIKDAHAMAKMATQLGFTDTCVLTDEAATRNQVKAHLDHWAAGSRAGDLFFLSFAGHGTQREALFDDEADGKNETWCLYDHILLDNELHQHFQKFDPDCRIIVISDSCHCATVTRDLSPALSRSAPPEVQRFVSTLPLERDTGLIPLEQDPTILLFAACRDDQEAYEGENGHGQFTEAILSVWDEGNFLGSYQDLFGKVVEKATHFPIQQSPVLTYTGQLQMKEHYLSEPIFQ